MSMIARVLRILSIVAVALIMAAPGHAVQIPADDTRGDGARLQPGGTGQSVDPATGAVFRETDLDRRVKAIASQLRCVVCQGVSIEDSPSTLAQEMRDVVRERLIAGDSPEQVKAYFVDRYGEWVLLKPKASGFNLLIYLLPIAVVMAGAAFIFLKARSWVTPADGDGTGAA
jgi:cytochrome c-type biogenesis protein CcmH